MTRRRFALASPLYQVSIEDRCVHLRGPGSDVTLVFSGKGEVEVFLDAFAEAWARWDRTKEEPAETDFELQYKLPF